MSRTIVSSSSALRVPVVGERVSDDAEDRVGVVPFGGADGNAHGRTLVASAPRPGVAVSIASAEPAISRPDRGGSAAL